MRKLATIGLVAALALQGCATTEEGKAAQSGAAQGAATGAMIGLFLGALTGDADVAARATAAGALSGAYTGGVIGYTESREDQRTRVLADAIGGAQAGETADQAGKRHLQDFLGDWNAAIWVVDEQGNRIDATGRGSGVMRNANAIDFNVTDIAAPDGSTVAVNSKIAYDETNGFTLNASTDDGVLQASYVGEYLPAENKFRFFAADGGSSIVVHVRIASAGLIFVETFATIDGSEKQIENVRLTRAM